MKSARRAAESISIDEDRLSPMAIVGAILAQGVIRLNNKQNSKQNQLDNLTEERVHEGVLTPKDNTHE